jgi:hypothetical protein
MSSDLQIISVPRLILANEINLEFLNWLISNTEVSSLVERQPNSSPNWHKMPLKLRF